jgi:capsular polysaccharide biosynthesis protein
LSRLSLIVTWIAVVAISAGVCAFVAFVASSQRPLVYTSQASILIGPPLGGQINESDINVGQDLRSTYADLATTRPLLDRVVAESHVDISTDDLVGDVSASVPANSTLLVISVATGDPNKSAVLANAVASELVAYPTTQTDSKTTSNVAVSVVDPAVPATSAQDRHILLGTAAGAGIGLLIAAGFAFLVENLRQDRKAAEAKV